MPDERVDKKVRRRRAAFPIWPIWLVPVFILAFFIVENTDFALGTTDLHMSETGVRLNFDLRGDFHSYGGRSFFVLTDGSVQNFSSSGEYAELNWQLGVELQNPIMAARGNVIAVGEERGRRIYVYNKNGLLFTAVLEAPAIFYTVNATGYLSVIMQTDDGHEVRVFAPGRAEPLYRNAIRTQNVFPFSVDVSEDGRIAVISLLDTSTGLNSRVTFNFMLEADSRGITDGLFAFEQFDEQLVHHVRIVGDRVLVFSDMEIRAFSLPVTGAGANTAEIWRIALNNRIESFDVSDSHFAYVTGEPFLNIEGEPPGTVNIYNLDGRRMGSHQLGRLTAPVAPTRLSMNFGGILVGSGRTFYALNNRGGVLWSYSALHDVRHAAFLDNTESLLIATSREIILYRRTR